MYPSSEKKQRSNRVMTDTELSSFYAGTQFRTFKEISLAAGATYVAQMVRSVDLVLRGFTLHVNTGEIRCEIYRGAVPSGSFTDAWPIISKCEFSDNPAPIYQPKVTIVGGGSFSGGTLYDLMHIKTAGASGQASTAGDERDDQLGIPGGSIGIYKFSNPGNSAAVGIFTAWWEELPIK